MRRGPPLTLPEIHDPFPGIDYLTSEQLCQLLTGLDKSDLQQARNRKNDKIPHIRVSDRKILYPKALVLEWWKRRLVC